MRSVVYESMMDGGEDDVTSLRHALTSLAVDDAVKIIRLIYLHISRCFMVYGQTGVCIDVASQAGDVVLGFVAAIMVFDGVLQIMQRFSQSVP